MELGVVHKMMDLDLEEPLLLFMEMFYKKKEKLIKSNNIFGQEMVLNSMGVQLNMI